MYKMDCFIGAIGFFGLASAAGADTAENWSHGYNHMLWGTGYGMFGGVMMLLFWGVVIALIVFAVRWASDSGSSKGSQRSNALEILQERFARGEIDEDEYRKRKAALTE